MMGEQAIAQARTYDGERELAEALSSLDAGAWRQLFNEQYDRVYAYAWLRIGNAADAEDVAASVFVEAVKGIRSFRYRGVPVAAWLFRIAHHETVDALKRRSRRPTTSLDVADAGERLAHDSADAADQWRDVADALGRLKQEHRDVLMLRLIEGRSVRDVAAMLGKSEGAVKVLQMRALQALRRRLEG
jgi:RNA polymerase sigma-70 factor (ECF subfamily)